MRYILQGWELPRDITITKVLPTLPIQDEEEAEEELPSSHQLEYVCNFYSTLLHYITTVYEMIVKKPHLCAEILLLINI
jgi:hypothetical protein